MVQFQFLDDILIGSMGLVYLPIHELFIFFMVNVGKYIIHGLYGIVSFSRDTSKFHIVFTAGSGWLYSVVWLMDYLEEHPT